MEIIEYMDFEWVAIAFGDVAWITLAFLMGFLASLIKLPPLVGYLVTGFILNYLGVASGEMLQKIADLGVTLLLFTVGLKLDLKSLAKPQVWTTTVVHMSLVTVLFGLFVYFLALIGLPLFIHLDIQHALLVGFALCFSSTVFVVKVLEEKGEMKSRHGRIAIGILIMQDLAAVIFLAMASGKLPTIWALLLLLLIPLRIVFTFLLQRSGHGELLILYGLVLALGGAELFELAGIKDDLGALIMGLLMSTHSKSKELAKNMLGFKDLFLVGFFLTIGLSGQLSLTSLLIGILLVPLIVIKSGLFFLIMTRLKLRARTALLSTLHLSNYSEFGLIVIAICVSNNWLAGDWLIVIAIALSVSFIIAASLSRLDNHLYSRFREIWRSMQHLVPLPDDAPLDTKNSKIAVFGMGRVGQKAYQELSGKYEKNVIGVDFDGSLVEDQIMQGRYVLHGDPEDPDFWEKIEHNPKFELILLALPNLRSSLRALSQLKAMNYPAEVAAVVRYSDEEQVLREHGVTTVFNIYTQAGAGFAEQVMTDVQP